MKSSTQVRNRRRDALSLFLVCAVSLLLLVYVGLGEAQRTLIKFQIAKLAAQGEIVQHLMETHLRAGLGLRQFIGFQPITDRILSSDSGVIRIAVLNSEGVSVFINDRADEFSAERPLESGERVQVTPRFEARQNDLYLYVSLPLRNRFEVVGQLMVVMPLSVIESRVNQYQTLFLGLTLGCSVILALLAYRFADLPRPDRLRLQRWGFTSALLIMTVVFMVVLSALYAEGAQITVKALADSLGKRVGAIVDNGIDLKDIEGLERAFDEYRRDQNNVRAIGLIENGRVVIHTEPQAAGREWISEPGTFEYSVAVGKGAQSAQIAVSLSADVVYRAVVMNIKNFAALFLAVGFLSALFLHLANALHQDTDFLATPATFMGIEALEKVKPVLFIAVFVDNLSASFLPQLLYDATTSAQLPPALASLAFMTYFFCFAFILVPAGYLAERRGPKFLIGSGSLLAAAGSLILVFSTHLASMVLARILSGCGQGLLLIGVQSFILAAAPIHQQTQANGIIVYNFNAGMIAGMALGSLLAIYVAASGVFALGGTVLLLLALYAGILPTIKSASAAVKAKSRLGGISGIFKALGDLDFLKTMFLIGVPSKAILTGVLLFAMPLLLSTMGFDHEEIGQIIMFYAIGVLLSNFKVSRWIDQSAGARKVLFFGMIVCAFGLLLMGSVGLFSVMGWPNYPVIETLVLLVGVFIVGLAHGAINAPVVTHVANGAFAAHIGIAPATAIYRFLERFGHIAGPIVVGQLLYLGDNSVLVIGWIGLAILIFAFLFGWRESSSKSAVVKGT